MRARNPTEERTTFQEGGPYDPRIDSKADVAMVYGLDRDFEARMAGWGRAGYRLHVMTGVSWGGYADYVRGQWDGVAHYDDAQTATGAFRLEHGMSQGHDIYYMMPSMTYVKYLAEKMHRVVDAGALALHLEEPEFWVRAGYEEGFKHEWLAYYHEEWRDPASSPDARYRCEKLKQYLYVRALSYLFADVKRYARSKGVNDFKCYVPTHSLLNYAHWRIISPESQLLQVPDCDGIIGQVWTGTSRTPNVYRGVMKQRTFEAGYCEYASCGAMVRGTNLKVWQLADPIEDNPNYSWDDYRQCWECDITASLLSSDNTRFEIMPWPSRIFTRSYPRENLDGIGLKILLDAYIARLDKNGMAELSATTRRAIAAFSEFHHDHWAEIQTETLGFANLADASSELRFGDILGGAFAFYKHLSTWPDKEDAARLRDAVSAFYHDPTDEREYIPASYATELQVVFNALADMDWPRDYEWIHGQTGVGVAIADTLMYQRGDPTPSDPDMSSFYGLAMPLIKRGAALSFVQLERLIGGGKGYMNGIRVLVLTYEGMKPSHPEIHTALANWVRQGNALVIFSVGDAYDDVREWWNENGATRSTPFTDLMRALGLVTGLEPGIHDCGAGIVILEPASPSELAHRVDGADVVLEQVKLACARLGLAWTGSNALVFRRGPYICAGGMDESEAQLAVVLSGQYVDLFDPHLRLVTDPVIAPDTRWLLADLSRYAEGATVIAAAGRVMDEVASENGLTFHVAGIAKTTCAVRVKLPSAPISFMVDDQAQLVAWDADTHTALAEFPNVTQGVALSIRW